MSTPAATANSILDLLYRTVTFATMAINATASPATTLDIALHTAAPVTASQTSNEANYGAYARVAVARTTGGWNAAASGSTANTALIQFIECTSGSNTITHVSIGFGGTILAYGSLSASRSVSSGIQPQFGIASLVSSLT